MRSRTGCPFSIEKSLSSSSVISQVFSRKRKMRHLLYISIFPALWSSALSSGLQTDCVDGVRTVIADFVFTGGEDGDYWGNLCANNLSTLSMWSAAKKYCTPDEISAGNQLLGGYCTEYGGVELIPYSDVSPLLTDSFFANLPIVDYSDINESVVWDHAILMSRDLYAASYRTITVFEESYLLDSKYGWGVYGFWGALLIVGMAHNLSSYLLSSRLYKGSGDVEGKGTSANHKPAFGPLGTVNHWVRANLIIPTAFGTHHRRLLWWCNIPTRMETLVVLSYWFLNLVLCAVSYYIFTPNLYYSPAQQRWRYIADRTGVLSYANLPVLWMFSGRNNVFLWLTGWSFQTFNIFHRHVARIATILAIIHSICYTGLEWDYLAADWAEKYWYMGGMATVTMSFLLLFSSVWLRKRAYEIFLLIHIVMSVLTLVGLWYHTEIWDGEYDPYIWPPVAIWSVDRLARLVRILCCNLRVKFSGQVSATQALVTYHTEANLLKIEITPVSHLFKPGAGQHYYLYQPLKWKGWENHPFTLAGWKNGDTQQNHTTATQLGANISGVPDDSKGHDKETQIMPVSSSSSDADMSQNAPISPQRESQAVHVPNHNSRDTFTFYVRPHSSWTQRLRNECNKSVEGTISARMLIEGPYGHHSPLRAHENVIFVVGGTGIGGAIPYLQEHSESLTSESKIMASRTKNITLIWATKQSAMIRHAATTDLKPFLTRTDVTTQFFATSRTESSESVQSDKLEKVNSLDLGLSPAIRRGRPDVTKAILDYINTVHSGSRASGQVAVFTCGPAAMADDARVAVHKALKEGKRGVAYFEETFGW
ncbi:hypothetical protein PV10_09231 [Exophiala mesophila]|uniref:FAD-binding FR-type domain-containing protein n=1 Tax=Exophiala mesophila TaxID=212818 RepID=A0A0D1ZMG3_EXOME|nr:uncharacterized protein PV10_09231 [Exophiala mesophila]KIV87953.1 hypothetical protein PV10_09231 [Exophiala mesophila]